MECAYLKECFNKLKEENHRLQLQVEQLRSTSLQLQLQLQLHSERVATAPTGQQAGTSAAARIFTLPLSGYNPSRGTWFSPNAHWSCAHAKNTRGMLQDSSLSWSTDKKNLISHSHLVGHWWRMSLGRLASMGIGYCLPFFFSPGRRGQEFSALFLLKPVVLRRWSWGLTIARSASV